MGQKTYLKYSDLTDLSEGQIFHISFPDKSFDIKFSNYIVGENNDVNYRFIDIENGAETTLWGKNENLYKDLNLQRIKITPEWLSKFAILENVWFENESFKIIKNDILEEWDFFITNASHTKKLNIVGVRFVDELQDLYFVLTKNKLKIK